MLILAFISYAGMVLAILVDLAALDLYASAAPSRADARRSRYLWGISSPTAWDPKCAKAK